MSSPDRKDTHGSRETTVGRAVRVVGGPSDRLIAVAVGAIVVADIVTWGYFGIVCGAGENSPETHERFCEPPLYWLPALGGIAALVGGVAALTGRWWAVILGLASGAVPVIGLWMAY